jgi:hypothetical protein
MKIQTLSLKTFTVCFAHWAFSANSCDNKPSDSRSDEGLFCGAVSLVGFSDVLTTMSDPSIPLTVTEWDEWCVYVSLGTVPRVCPQWRFIGWQARACRDVDTESVAFAARSLARSVGRAQHLAGIGSFGAFSYEWPIFCRGNPANEDVYRYMKGMAAVSGA